MFPSFSFTRFLVLDCVVSIVLHFVFNVLSSFLLYFSCLVLYLFQVSLSPAALYTQLSALNFQ